ncbi:MAG: C-terminal binding protein [Anaerolineales bacterium]|nr:C-terminal binding protein [Anaerolineales bacterium]
MPLKILVTDYNWPSLEIEREVLRRAGAELVVAETGTEAEFIRLAGDVAGILTCWKHVTPAVLDAAPRCRTVARYGVGLDNIAVGHATELGMVVTNVPDYCYEEVSDHAMALLLACARKVASFAAATNAGRWDLKAGWPLPRLRGQTLGIIGFGRIGRALAPKAAGFGLQVVVYSPREPRDRPSFVRWTNDLDEVLAQSDYVSLHVPLTEATRGLMNAGALAKMKPSAYLINTARGAVIDEAALLAAVQRKVIAGAALDVLTTEPPPAGHPLLGQPGIILTPHAAFYSEAAIEELQQKAAEHVAQALRGEWPENVVNPQVREQANYRAVGQAA